MRRAFRLATGSVAVLLGIACLLFAVRVLVRAGLPGGAKAVAYLWILPLTILLPISLGVNLVFGLLPWRMFVGCWLIACAALELAGFLWFVLLDYRVDLVSLIIFSTSFLALLSGGIFLLLMKRRPPVAR